jgi:transposase
MAKRHFQLSEREIGQLRQREQQTHKVAELKRLQAVRLYGSGMRIAPIMDMVGCAESSIRAWVQAYQGAGLAGLSAHHDRSAQNASKLSVGQRTELGDRLHQYRPHQVVAPALRISQGQFWTVRDLQIVVEQWYGVVYADQGSYRHLFDQCGFSYQRAERVYRSRPSEAEIADFEAELEKSDRFSPRASHRGHSGA